MKSQTLPNGVVTTTDYDGLGRMKFWKNSTSTATLNEHQYGYNTANQITWITEPTVRTRNIGYDNSERLTSTTSTQSFRYLQNVFYLIPSNGITLVLPSANRDILRDCF